MACAEGVLTVELEVQTFAVLPAEALGRQHFPLQDIDKGEVPGQHVHAKSGFLVDTSFVRLGERGRVERLSVIADEFNPAVDVPADDQDLVPRCLQAREQRREISLALNEPSKPRRLSFFPAVLIGK
jgi:hypothetical protein